MKNRTMNDLSTYRKTVATRRKASTTVRCWARLVELQNAVTRRLVAGAKA